MRTMQIRARAMRRKKFWRETVPVWVGATLFALACMLDWGSLLMG